MRSLVIALLLCALTFGTTSYAQQTSPSLLKAQSFWNQFSLLKNRTHAVQNKQLYSVEEAAKRLLTSRNKQRAANARYTPEWCYTEGKITTLKDGVQKYYIERYEYTTEYDFTITYDEVTQDGQFIAEVRKGMGSLRAR